MERKQKRGWLKFALTTALALAFMGVMAVTAMAATHGTIRFVPADVPEAFEGFGDVAINVYLDIVPGQNVGGLGINLDWDTSLMTLNRVQRPGPPPTSTPVNPGPWWVVPAGGQPPLATIEAGSITIGVVGALVGDPPSTGNKEDSLVATLFFDVVDRGNTTFVAAFDDGVTIIDSGLPTARPEALASGAVAVSGTVVNGLNALWSFYGADTATQNFITAVTTVPNTADWFTFLVNEVWPASGRDSVYAAYSDWHDWIAAAAEAE